MSANKLSMNNKAPEGLTNVTFLLCPLGWPSRNNTLRNRGHVAIAANVSSEVLEGILSGEGSPLDDLLSPLGLDTASLKEDLGIGASPQCTKEELAKAAASRGALSGIKDELKAGMELN